MNKKSIKCHPYAKLQPLLEQEFLETPASGMHRVSWLRKAKEILSVRSETTFTFMTSFTVAA